MPPDPSDDRRDEPPDEHPVDDKATNDESADDEPTNGGTDSSRSRSDDSDTGLLSSLLHALESLDRIPGSGSDRRRGSATRLDYDVSIRSGLDAIGSGPEAGRNRPSYRRPDSVSARSHGRRSSRRRRPSSSHRTTIRTEDEEVVVVADVAGADPDAVTVGYSEGDLVIGVEGTEIERLEIPWSDSVANARVKNGILTVTVERGGDVRE